MPTPDDKIQRFVKELTHQWVEDFSRNTSHTQNLLNSGVSYYDITLRSILLKEQLAGDPSFAEAILNYALALSQKRGEEDPKPVIDAMIRVVNDVYNAQPGQGFVPDAEERKAYGSSLNRSTSYTLMIAATKFQQRSRNALEDPTNPPNKTR